MCGVLRWVSYKDIQVYLQMNHLWRWWQSNTDLVPEQGKTQLFTAPEAEQTAPGERASFVMLGQMSLLSKRE